MTLNPFSRSKPRAEAPVRVSVLTLPPLKSAYDADHVYCVPRLRETTRGTIAHLDNAARRLTHVYLSGPSGGGKSGALHFLSAYTHLPVYSFADYHPQALPDKFENVAWILFDDVSEPAHTAHLQALAAKYPAAKIWAAGRDAKALPEGFESAEVLPLNEREISAIAEAWFLRPAKGPSHINRPAQNFMASVQAHAGTREVATSPFYLFLLLQVYQPLPKDAPQLESVQKVALPMVGGAATPFDVPQRTNVSPLPTRRAELFNRYVTAKLANESDPDFAARAVEGIALSTKRGQRAGQDHLARGYGLLEERASGQIQFKHTLLQDFLAARALRRNPDFAPMQEHLGEPAWREVAVFYAGLGDASEIVNAALESGDLEFAAAALAATAEPKPDLLEKTVKALVARAWDDHDDHAVTALGALRSNLASDFFAAKLRDRNAQVRERAAEILGKLHTDRALEYLLPQLRDPSPEVRDQVIAALGTSRSERVVEPLLVALRGDPRVASSDTRMKIAAAKALGEYGTDKAVPALLVDLQVSDADVRDQAVIALEKIRSAFAIKPLNEIATKDKKEQVRAAAEKVLHDMQGA